jgi:hypothetical protein
LQKQIARLLSQMGGRNAIRRHGKGKPGRPPDDEEDDGHGDQPV